MHGCTVYTLPLLICGLAHTQTHTFSKEFPFSFSISFPTHTWLYADMFPLAHTHRHTYPQLFWLCTMVAFPAVYQTNVWVVFSSTGLNILFHFPLPHCLTHKYPPIHHTHHTCTHAHAPSSYSLTRRNSAPHSKSKRLMCLLGQNEIVCHYKALHYRTPE